VNPLLRCLHWLHSHPNAPAWLQAAAALITLLLTMALSYFAYVSAVAAKASALAANRSVDAALEGLKTARDDLQISKDMMNLEWNPDVRIAGVARAGTGSFVVTVANLGMKSVLVETVIVRWTHHQENFPYEKLIPSGSAIEVSLGIYFNTFVQKVNVRENIASKEPFGVKLAFTPTGRPRSFTNEKEYTVYFSNSPNGAFANAEEA
jgi:hypothetical protein